MDDKRDAVASDAARRKSSVLGKGVTSVLGDGEVVITDRALTADEEILLALGYKPEFKREFT